jgi:hypothetical protein
MKCHASAVVFGCARAGSRKSGQNKEMDFPAGNERIAAQPHSNHDSTRTGTLQTLSAGSRPERAATHRAKVINSRSVRRSASIPCRAGQIRLSSMHRPPPNEGRVGRPSRRCVGRRPALNPSLRDLRFTPDHDRMEVDGIELPQCQLSMACGAARETDRRSIGVTSEADRLWRNGVIGECRDHIAGSMFPILKEHS